MSGDVTYAALKRLTFLPERDDDENGSVIAGQDYDNVYFIGGNISNVTFSGGTGSFADITADTIETGALKITPLVNSRAIVSNGTGDIGESVTTATELSYVNGVTSAIQTQLNNKQPLGTYVTSVSGTSNRISIGGTATVPIVDISTNYAGQNTITTLGTVTTGTWHGSVVDGQYGGTGVNNSGKTITLGGNLTTSGAFSTTFTVSGNTNITLPTSGTMITDSGSATLTNKTINGSSNTITNVSLTTGVTGTLPIGNGGTGQTTANAALNAFLPAQSAKTVLTSNGTNTSFDGTFLNYNNALYVRDEKPNNTDGGTSSTGPNIRTLNTVVFNNISGASLASNQVTLPAGTYIAKARTPNFRGTGNKAYLYNTVLTVVLGSVGSSAFCGAADQSVSDSFLMTPFTLGSATAIELREAVGAGVATNGLGSKANVGLTEVFAELWIWKVG